MENVILAAEELAITRVVAGWGGVKILLLPLK